MVKWVSTPALCQPQWIYQGVAFRRMRGKWVAREVSPQEWGMGVDQKDPILRTGRKNLGVQKGRAQGERDMKNGVKRLSPIQEQNLRSHTAALSCHWLKMRVSVSFISFYSTPQEGLMNSNLTPIMLDSRALTRI